MKRILPVVLLGVATTAIGLDTARANQTATEPQPQGTMSQCPPADQTAQVYDVIIYGDEVPGVMTALQVKRELWKRKNFGRVALITEGDTDQAIGGHLVRGGLAYLDRNQIPPDLRSRYGLFGIPSPLYQQFLRSTGTKVIALDRVKAANVFAQELKNVRVDVIGNIELNAVQTTDQRVCSFSTTDDRTFVAKKFIDASQSGELAEASGVEMMQGFSAVGLPNSTLSLGLVLDVYGLSIEKLKQIEATLIERFQNPADRKAQQWLDVASGKNQAKRKDLLASMVDASGKPKLLYQGTVDSADVRSLALSVAMHGSLGREYDLKSSGFLFDRANIAAFDDRLSFNALLFDVDAPTARKLSQAGAKPTPTMLETANKIKQIFQSWGAERVEIMDELYIRNAGQIANPLDELSATLMAAGGVPELSALGTFSYHLDDRGGVEGLAEKVIGTPLALLNYKKMPTFNYGISHTLPQERHNLAVIGPASGFGGLGTTAGRIVEFNVGVGQGVAIAIAKALSEDRTLHTITNREVRQALGHTPNVYGYSTKSFQALYRLESKLRAVDYEQTYLERGVALLKQGNYEQATEELARAAILDSKQPRVYSYLGDALTYLGFSKIAVTVYSEAIRLDPNFAEAYRSRGFQHLDTSNFNQAIADFEQALKLTPSDATAQFGKGFAIALRSVKTEGQPLKQALPFINRSIKQQPDLALAYLVRGLVQLDLNEHKKALTDLEQASKLFQSQENQLGYDQAQKSIQNIVSQSP